MLSGAIYVDANVLISMQSPNSGFRDLQSVALSYGIRFYAPEVVIKETLEWRRTEANRLIRGVNDAARKLHTILGHNPVTTGKELSLDMLVDEEFRRYLESLEVEAIPIPADLSISLLIDRAIKHEAPFQDKDKGFRDAVILESIVSHMRKEGIQKAIFLSQDKGYSSEGMGAYLQKCALALDVAANLEHALEILNQQIDSAVADWRRQKENLIREFLEIRLQDLLLFVKDHAEINEKLLTGEGLFGTSYGRHEQALPAGSRVDRILERRPESIGNVTYLPGLSKSEGDQICDVAWVSVVTQFDLVVTSTAVDPMHFLGRTFSPSSGGVFEAGTEETPIRICQSETTVERRVTVKVEVGGTEDRYVNLCISDRLF